MLGLSTNGTTLLMAYIINIMIVIIVMGMLKDNEYQKEIGIALFFGLLLIEVLLGMISWLVFLIPLLIVGMGWIHIKRGES